MGEIRRRPQFIEDIADIWTFIAQDSESRANHFIRQLEEKYQILSDAPLIGVAKLPDMPTVRLFPYRRYVIVYKPLRDGTGIELIRLFHGAQNWQQRLSDEL